MSGVNRVAPEVAFGIDLVALGNDRLDRQVHKFVVHHADDQLGLARHSRVDRRVTQPLAVHGVAGICRRGADRVTGIDVLEVDLHFQFIEVFEDTVPQVGPHIGHLEVAAGIGFFLGHQLILHGPFGDNDYRVLAALEALFKVVQKTIVSFQVEGNFGDQHEVYLVTCQGGAGGDVARFPPHHLHQADAVNRRGRLHVGGGHHFNGLFHCGVKAK